MQVISKLEHQQQQQPSSPCSSSTSNSTPKTARDLMQTITQFLEKGHQSALQLRTMLHNKRSGFKLEEYADDHQQQLSSSFDHHTWVALDSIESCLTMIKSYDLHLEDDDMMMMIMKKRKLDHQPSNSDAECSDLSSIKSEETTDGGKIHRERRGCYKRRKTGQTWTVEATNLIDDGHAWRKYGQKEILNTKFPRNYYRCTHKNDQDCQATKQVQQISENPTKYTIIYHGQHTCKNLLKTPSIFIDNALEQKPAFFLSFDTKNYPPSKHALTPSIMFPSSSAFYNNSNNNNSSNNNNNNPTLAVKQEQPHPINNEAPLAPHDHDGDNHNPSPSPSPSSSLSDLTSTGFPSTPVSEQGDVNSSSPPPAESFQSSINISNPYDDMNGDDMINFINMDQHLNASLDDGFWADLWDDI